VRNDHFLAFTEQPLAASLLAHIANSVTVGAAAAVCI